MAGGLRTLDDDGAAARCRFCSAEAVGPCASCRAPVCGACCVLSSGGATTFAICRACDERGGRSLGGAWLGLLGWLAGIVALLAAVAALVVWAS